MEVAQAQLGMVHADQARAAGMSSRMVRWRISSGRWRQIYPRVYWTSSGPIPPLALCWAALLYAGSDAALSHHTATALHGLRGAELVPIHVTIPEARRVRARPGLVVHRSVVTGGDTATLRRGLRCHRPERALLDVASLQPGRAAAVLAAGVQEGLTTPARLRDCLGGLPASQRGRRLLTALVEELAGGTRSELEHACLRLLRRAGLPEPCRDHEIVLPDRRVRLDLCYPAYRIAVEVDGRAFHVWSDAWQRDLDRQNSIVLAGWLVLRFTGEDLRRRPGHVTERVRAALAIQSTG